MKKIFILPVLLFTFVSSYAHDGEIHKYIVFRAYQMLERRYIEAGGNPQDLQEIRSKIINTDGTQCNLDNDNNHPIVKGSFQEDKTDPIYFKWEDAATFTHFWKADDGDYQKNWIVFPNALMKTYAYLFSNGGIYRWTVFLKNREGGESTYEYIQNSDLIQFYLTGSCKRIYYNVVLWTKIYHGDFQTVVYPEAKRLSYEILGRTAHLLADMSIPAHVHIDSHPADFGDADEYEYNYMRDVADSLFADPENLVNDDGFMPYLVEQNNRTFIRTLFYTMNQVTSHFSSNDKDGNNNVSNATMLIDQKLNAWGAAETKPTKDVQNTATKTFNFCVGATATLFYWFGINTGMLKTKIKDQYFNTPIPNPTLLIYSDNSINLQPGFEFSGKEMLLMTGNATGGGRRNVPQEIDLLPDAPFMVDSIMHNIPCDTIYIN